jgi:hypothetical protein
VVERVLVVDAANVVGSRPDGWWRDRAGAASRLHARLHEAELPYDIVVLVLEGRARAGVDEGTAVADHPGPGHRGHPRVLTIHAPAAGDDELVARCRAASGPDADVTLVTADRGLAARVAGLGVTILGPSALLALLPADPAP